MVSTVPVPNLSEYLGWWSFKCLGHFGLQRCILIGPGHLRWKPVQMLPHDFNSLPLTALSPVSSRPVEISEQFSRATHLQLDLNMMPPKHELLGQIPPIQKGHSWCTNWRRQSHYSAWPKPGHPDLELCPNFEADGYSIKDKLNLVPERAKCPVNS